ncbi:MAG: DUF4445 domain-containing protein [Proteobacteria bacterium]|nr:DUF4445 domain-containing protein [Pseudomonadota bacterium]
MASLTLIPGGQTKDFPSSTRLLDALLDMGVVVSSPCGGKGSCGKCGIRCDGGLSAKTDLEKNVTGNNARSRLACQAELTDDVTVFIDEKRIPLQKSYPAVNPEDRYAIAADIGTTSVSVDLVCLTNGKQISLDTFLNPQRRFGHDVISRIAAANNPENKKIMTRQIRQAVLGTITEAISAMKVPLSHIEKIVFSGNTTMLYLLFGMDVSGLGRFPFEAFCLDFDGIEPSAIDAGMFPNARISAVPAVSAFLGGDFLGGLTLCREKEYRENTFFIDLGTNGEMFLINGSGPIYATSCAMGPALEGINISRGMTADEGAITHVRIDFGELVHTKIGDAPPVGLSGTALIDLVALFLSEGCIRKNGRFADDGLLNLPGPATFEKGEKSKQIRLWNDIAISQKDVRNLQLAKAASLAAARLMLQEAGCAADDVTRVLIAGDLGSHLDKDNFRSLGFLPDFPNATFHFLGNTSLQAAASICVDELFYQKAVQSRGRVREVVLSGNPEFSKEFIKSIEF